MSVLRLDFETFSLADLRKTGAAAYAQHPSTGISCMAWAFDDEAVQVWTPKEPFPPRVSKHVLHNGQVHGWNVMFEYWVWNSVLLRLFPGVPDLKLEQIHCSMAAAAYWGLPMSLDQAGAAIGSTYQKDKVGHALMLRMSKPRRMTGAGEPIWWHLEDPVKYAALQAYCHRDVEAERSIAKMLPALPDAERQIWLMDARMNARGFLVDVGLVQLFQQVVEEEVGRLDAMMNTNTAGAVKSTRALADLKKFLVGLGEHVEDLTKADVAELIDTVTNPVAKLLLTLRKEAAKTSTAKLNAMLNAMCDDHRVRGLVMHYGASRTGRWAGRLVQVQNLPRPAKGIDTDRVINDVLTGADADTIQFVHGPVLDAVSSCLRACFVAPPGKTFAVCDYSAIEARVIAWLAGQQDILDVFAKGEDVYVHTAAKINSTDRQLGKVSVLGLGFGMGAVKFVDAAATYKITLTPERAQEVVTAWRKANAKIVAFWYDLDRAVRDAIENGRATQVGYVRVSYTMNGNLIITLPSGRQLVYRNARIEHAGDGSSSITYEGTNQYTRKWETIRSYGGKFAENITQAVARCLLADAMLRMERNHLPIVASIHDEVVCEVPEAMATASFNQMKTIMSDGPAWAAGLPLGGAGYIGRRYAKG